MAFIQFGGLRLERSRAVRATCQMRPHLARGFSVKTRAVEEEGSESPEVDVAPSTEEETTSADGVPTDVYPGPVAPENFVAPEPKPFTPYADTMGKMALATLSAALRVGSGFMVQGYSIRNEDGKIIEYSSSLPESRPELPLELYEFEACPFCMKVREALSILDLDSYIYPCPKGGKRFRTKVLEMGGKEQFPYLVDPNTGFAGYESDDIVRYLFETYGDGSVPAMLNMGPITALSSGLSSVVGGLAGAERAEKVVYPERPLTLWAYEPSSFCRIARTKMCEYEIPYLLKTTARGSPTRQEMIDTVGRFQAPYLEDPNTNISMFESKYIMEYLDDVYGPNAQNAVADVPANLGLVKSVMDA